MKIDLELVDKLKKTDFNASAKSSGEGPKTHMFTGLSLKAVLDEAGAKTEGMGRVIIRGTDGYTCALPLGEVMEDDNVYITCAVDGESGPLQLVIKNDRYSQRWCKYVTEVELL